MPNKQLKWEEKILEEVHLKGLSKSVCSSDIKEELTVLPLGHLTTICKWALKEQEEKHKEEMRDMVDRINDFGGDESDAYRLVHELKEYTNS